MSPALVRPITRPDVAAAVAVLVGGSLHPEHEDPTRLDDYWQAVESTRARDGDVLVAELDGDIVGVVQLIVFAHFQHAGRLCAELESVHVRADHRSQGIGAALVSYAEDLARTRGCYRIQLTSNVVRTDAHRFYGARGYTHSHVGFKKSLSGD